MTLEDLDWGAVTPEFYCAETREALHVINAKCIGKPRRDRVCRFVVARLVHYAKHLPEGCSQRVRFDLRGQLIGDASLAEMRESITAEVADRGISVSVEFLSN
jgi:hypothetical protein